MMNWKAVAGVAGGIGIAVALAMPAWSQPVPQSATALVKDASGKSIGVIELTTAPTGLALSARFTGLPPGTHAFHIHEKGVCEGDFKSAGGHFNPTHAQHGFMNEAGLHAGDMPNLEVPASGAVDVNLFLAGVSLSPASPANLNDADGSAFVIHAGPDDYTTDPTGNAGARAACGVVQVKEAK